MIDRVRYIDEKAIEAKKSTGTLEVFIKEYEHFILSCAADTSGHFVDKSDDEWSIALWAFYEAVQSYDFDKGRFLAYAKLLIRSRLIDYFRSQNRHSSQVSLDLIEEDEISVQATSDDIRFEIEALEQTLCRYGFEWMDLAGSSPKASKTRQACKAVIQFIIKSPILVEEMRRTKMLPTKMIEGTTRVPRKLIERHRKYIVTAVEILYDDYPHLSEYFDYIRKDDQT